MPPTERNFPNWLEIALAQVGTSEMPGKATSPAITRWLTDLRAWWNDDETPWCGVFAAWCIQLAGWAPPPGYYRALSWATWGDPLDEPKRGAIAVLRRLGGGHVFFVLGTDPLGRLVGVGGNQRDAVTVATFEPATLQALRCPPGTGWRLPDAPLIGDPTASSLTRPRDLA